MMKLLVFIVLVISFKVCWVNGEPQVPCFFIFGDSLSDNGNNNNLITKAKANYRPYGIDFPGGPSGRFSNGKNIVDFLAQTLGFDHLIPPFATATGPIILQGVNYASGSAGIRDETGQHLGRNVNLNQQLKNHQITINKMQNFLISTVAVAKQLNQCIYSIGIGNNDYLNNYFSPENYPTSKIFSPDQYAQVLINQYSAQLKSLYNSGARKFAIAGLADIGCAPFMVAKFGATNGSFCVENINQASAIFNQKLLTLIQQLNKLLPGAKFVFINSAAMGKVNPFSLGFKNFQTGCCSVREDGQCVTNGQVCPNRREYLFWDSFHPSEAVNEFTAASIYTNSNPNFLYPYDIHTLALVP